MKSLLRVELLHDHHTAARRIWLSLSGRPSVCILDADSLLSELYQNGLRDNHLVVRWMSDNLAPAIEYITKGLPYGGRNIELKWDHIAGLHKYLTETN